MEDIWSSANWKGIWRIRSNTELVHLIIGADIVRFNIAQRIKWLGHVQRMDTSRIAKRISEWKPMGSRPRLRWLNDVCDNPKLLRVRNCRELAMDRKTWDDLSEKSKTHRGL
jgi:hypothetical protein